MSGMQTSTVQHRLPVPEGLKQPSTQQPGNRLRINIHSDMFGP